MSASIFHGAPGSFKSASAMWFELLPALREGRVVVTNIEGLLTKETIEKELGETFPESAQIWRLSSQTENGLYLWRRWFWWMPIKAFIIIDEVQDIFPNDAKVFKPEELDSQGIESLKDKLPEQFYNYSIQAHKDFTPEIDEGSVDDTGQTIVDENGRVIYPKLMREANMRHRKYGWDIIYCTPVIDEIHKLVRGVCEFAYYHKYNQALEIIPYFKRRPRIHEHHPKQSGIPRKKDDATKWRFVPLSVHKCYRSTSTGVVTKKSGINAFKSPVFLINATVLLASIVYLVWTFTVEDTHKTVDSVPTPKNLSITQEDVKSSRKDRVISNSSNNNKTDFSFNVSLNLPYDSDQIYLNGYLQVILNKDKKYKDYFFTLERDEQLIPISSDDLYSFGIRVNYINECAVEIYSGNHKRRVYCQPRVIDNRPIQRERVDSTQT